MTGFVPVEIDPQQLAIVAFGATMLWVKMGWTGMQSVLGPLVLMLFPNLSQRWLSILEFVLFVVVGAFAGVLFSEPTNAKQALAAGLGWTAFLTASQKATSTRKGGNSGSSK